MRSSSTRGIVGFVTLSLFTFGLGQISSVSSSSESNLQRQEAEAALKKAISVVSVERLPTYRERFSQRHDELRPLWPSDDLVVVNLKVRNDEDVPVSPTSFIAPYLASLRTSEGVTEGGRLDWSLNSRVVASSDGPLTAEKVEVPRAVPAHGEVSVAVVFSVPKGEHPQALALKMVRGSFVQGQISIPLQNFASR